MVVLPMSVAICWGRLPRYEVWKSRKVDNLFVSLVINNTKHNTIGWWAGSVMGVTIGAGLATTQIYKVDSLNKNGRPVYGRFLLFSFLFISTKLTLINA